MKWKEFLGEYFTFTRKERIGLLVVILVTVGIWIFPKVSAPSGQKTVLPDTSWIIAAKNLMVRVEDSDHLSEHVDNLAYNKPSGELSDELKGQLFHFDPNVLSLEGWRKLGVREKTIATIQNYLHKGGHFYKAGDLKKIYGIRPDEYARLEPYIRITATSLAEQRTNEKAGSKKQTSTNQPKYVLVDINTADTSSFIALPGVGSKLAARIINFRDKLGGFYAVDQIGETYGLPDSSFQRIKPFLKLENRSIRKFNVNTASKDEMKSHPYLKWNLANAIVEYRTQHGNFSSLDDLKKISLISTEVFEKIKFYLTL